MRHVTWCIYCICYFYTYTSSIRERNPRAEVGVFESLELYRALNWAFFKFYLISRWDEAYTQIHTYVVSCVRL